MKVDDEIWKSITKYEIDNKIWKSMTKVDD